MAEVLVAGEWLRSRGHVSDITWSTRWGSGPCGDDIASCSFAVDPANDTSALRVGSSFVVVDNGVRVFGGVVDEVSRDFPRAVKARGLGRRAEDFDALSGSSPTSNVQAAVSGAIGRGLPWSNATAFPSTSIGSLGDGRRRVSALLSTWGETTGNRWGVDSYGAAFTATDPTSPTYHLDASGIDIGVTSDGLFTTVVATYVASVDANGNPATYGTVTASDADAVALYGRREGELNLSDLGVISSGTATTYATAQLALGLRPRWLQRVAVSSGRLLSPGGLPAHLPSVRAGQMVRLFNVPTNIGGTRYALALDVVLGEVAFDTTNPAQITLSPTNLAVRTLADAVRVGRR